ncbi:hypothetical protein CSE16_03485 [Solibacillus sp. R5-41]|uniref:hypothetical protein n=1 Tax=Solibacillus sp. R5-41 TaxID=2048654 RepID=UPI000C1277E2|nr:hypothetical protein [Solibacillus sp. R5-41]ATP39167.1 hypothetical protein CSE16_03485 [Solibacillus sp. R5-41]
MDDLKKMVDQLRNGEVETIHIKKSHYLQFREQLIKDEQFKQFRGEAKQGGDVIYTFLKEPRA